MFVGPQCPCMSSIYMLDETILIALLYTAGQFHNILSVVPIHGNYASVESVLWCV